MKLTRRKLFWASMSGVAAAAALYAMQPRKERWKSQIRRSGKKSERPFRVAVLGAGLAGLSTALELAERGVKVTVIEPSTRAGGKLTGWPISLEGTSFPIEHGFHGFFSQYYNFYDVLTRLKLMKNLAPVPTYPVIFPKRSEEIFGKTTTLFPFNLASVYAQSGNLKFGELARSSLSMSELLRFSSERTFREYDGISFDQFCQTQGLDKTFVETMLFPFAKTTFNHPKRVSAAHAISFMHYYFIGNPEGLRYLATTEDCMTAVIDPWVSHLKSLGVEFRFGHRAHEINLEQGQVVAVDLGETVTQKRKIAAVSEKQLTAVPAQVGVDDQRGPIFAYALDGKALAVRGRCTHQGCSLRPHSQGFDCPCHGGQFDLQGQVVRGPPEKPLERFAIEDGAIWEEARVPESLSIDAVVMCADTQGSRSMVQRSTQLPSPLVHQFSQLTEADPYLVWRVWMNKSPKATREAFYTTSDVPLLDSIALYHRLQEPYRQYYQRTGNAVLELHSYGVLPGQLKSPEENQRQMLSDLVEIFPEMEGAKVLHGVYQQQANFSGFPVGSNALRPEVHSEVPNLFFAGDWVKTPFSVHLMERAVTTGRMAANEILQSLALPLADIDIVTADGPLQWNRFF